MDFLADANHQIFFVIHRWATGHRWESTYIPTLIGIILANMIVKGEVIVSFPSLRLLKSYITVTLTTTNPRVCSGENIPCIWDIDRRNNSIPLGLVEVIYNTCSRIKWRLVCLQRSPDPVTVVAIWRIHCQHRRSGVGDAKEPGVVVVVAVVAKASPCRWQFITLDAEPGIYNKQSGKDTRLPRIIMGVSWACEDAGTPRPAGRLEGDVVSVFRPRRSASSCDLVRSVFLAATDGRITSWTKFPHGSPLH